MRWNINLNPVHLARPLYQSLATLLHELGHAWQHGWGTPSKPPHHNKEFRDKCEVFGIPTDENGHDRGVRHGSPFEAYCRQHGVAFPAARNGGGPGRGDASAASSGATGEAEGEQAEEVGVPVRRDSARGDRGLRRHLQPVREQVPAGGVALSNLTPGKSGRQVPLRGPPSREDGRSGGGLA